VRFAVAFSRDLPFGRCAAVTLPPDGVRDEDLAALHPEEAAHARGLGAARRVTWVGGRIALRSALRDLGVGPALGAIGATRRGAPELGPGLVGSVSHKESIAVALVARSAGAVGDPAAPAATLGIDVEIARAPRADIARRVLTPDELRRVEALDEAGAARELLITFSAKEAIYKALDPWVGRYVSFQEVALARDARGGLVATLSLAHAEGPFSVELHEEPVPGVVLVTARVSAAPPRG
jgi:4'-phosphopantetheinyl transferase EntD